MVMCESGGYYGFVIAFLRLADYAIVPAGGLGGGNENGRILFYMVGAEYDQRHINERQNIFDGTWQKTPSMGWMFVPLVQYHGGGQAATIEPLKDHLPHYGQRLANLFAAGVQACYRGPQLYDAPETKALVKKWVDFYKAHRQILDSDIIHVRRPDGRDYDAILHVDPTGDTKGMLVVYNPLNQPIKRNIKVNLYYTGLKRKAVVLEQDKAERTLSLDRDYNAVFKMNIPARGMTWFTVR